MILVWDLNENWMVERWQRYQSKMVWQILLRFNWKMTEKRLKMCWEMVEKWLRNWWKLTETTMTKNTRNQKLFKKWPLKNVKKSKTLKTRTKETVQTSPLCTLSPCQICEAFVLSCNKVFNCLSELVLPAARKLIIDCGYMNKEAH